jgi:putative membrane protein
MLLGDTISPPIQLHTLLTGFQTDGLSLVSLAIELGLALWYVLAVRRLAKRGRRWSRWRTASFLGGTALVIVAVQSGLAAYDDQVFAAHVVQHLLLMNFAPILYALSAPMTLALQASDRRTQQGLLKVLHTPVVEFVTNPVLVVLVSYGTMIAYFLTPFYNFSLEHPLVHDLTHLHFLVSGCLFWWLVVGRDPSRWRLSYPAKLGILAIGIPVTAVLGVSLTGARVSIAPLFHSVADTQRGGSILWIVGELTTFAAMAVIVFQWMRFEEREAVRADRLLDAQAALDAPGLDAQGLDAAAQALDTPSQT